MIARQHSSGHRGGYSTAVTTSSALVPVRAMTIAAVAVWLFVCAWSAAASQLYRWVDDDGKVHFSDRLPPEASDKARTELSDEGIPVREVERAKTRAEWMQEQEIERLRKEAQAQIDKQRREDEILLRSYRTADDLIMMRDGKIAAIDVMIQQIRGNVRRLQNQINRFQSNAADLERAGKPVDRRTEQAIASTKESIEGEYAQILQHQLAKQDIYEQFADDLERFRRLKDVREPVADNGSAEILLGLKNLVPCANDRECDLLWGQAVGYVETNSTEPIESLSNNVVITAAPKDDDDIGLILSRIPNDAGDPGAGALLFLDLQCRNYVQTALSCRTPARAAVVEGFREALLGAAESPADSAQSSAPEGPDRDAQTTEASPTTPGLGGSE
ncbi:MULTISPECIES: DUF4124 domain-containing protein [Thiorhodovibrio]|uniref:DUF4124 domain-containing protein n=1 Tax=Thiorhodovibrio TaxID=61593 RepID=UPI001911F6D8|nr:MULTISPECIES: DUF4124 domain-containing protein [Thiorhodovibrio]MBK5968751.1 hypothetical protein [Thiorhodovibrio winogradskyi]WPL10893.1 hypothetical protein Thiosp_00613 [Thiorhodovibrio litoralis]